MSEYPVLYDYSDKPDRHQNWPRTVPWDFIAEHEKQCQRNHSQTAAMLAQRGGLSLREIVAIVSDKDFYAVPKMTNDEATEWIAARIQECAAKHFPGIVKVDGASKKK